MSDAATREVVVPGADAMRGLGRRLAGLLRAGDLVLLTGDLGAGKTTFTQGVGVGLGVRGDVTSPTFVISRVHPSLVDGPPLVHVDAYRLGGVAELDDLDLDTAVEEAVTVVEWGGGVAEGLAEDRLEIALLRPRGDDPGEAGPEPDPAAGPDPARDPDPEGSGDEPRRVRLTGVGPRWRDAGLDDLVDHLLA